MYKVFRKNRIAVQKAILEQKFLIPLTLNDESLEVRESKTNERQLQSVVIEGVPVAAENETKSWILDLEIANSVFSKPANKKTVEKALIVFAPDKLIVFLIELKNSLHIGTENEGGRLGIYSIQRKIEDSIDRISLLLPIYVFDDKYDNIEEIEFKSLIFYNHDDNLHQQSTVKGTTSLENELFKVWGGKQKTISIVSAIGEERQVPCFFFKNPNQSKQKDSFKVSFQQFFFEEWEYESAQWGNQTCPVLLTKK